MAGLNDLDSTVRLAVYDFVIAHGRSPSIAGLASAVSAEPDNVRESLHRLADAHMLVLTPGTTNVWMAMPFSTVPTRFVVETPGRSYYANCAWDALGVPVVLGVDAVVTTACADCGEPVELKVENGSLRDFDGFVHFAVSVCHWWDDVGYT
jgi:hypothetical protein